MTSYRQSTSHRWVKPRTTCATEAVTTRRNDVGVCRVVGVALRAVRLARVDARRRGAVCREGILSGSGHPHVAQRLTQTDVTKVINLEARGDRASVHLPQNPMRSTRIPGAEFDSSVSMPVLLPHPYRTAGDGVGWQRPPGHQDPHLIRPMQGIYTQRDPTARGEARGAGRTTMMALIDDAAGGCLHPSHPAHRVAALGRAVPNPAPIFLYMIGDVVSRVHEWEGYHGFV